jgi:hypothetical protein
MDISSDYPRLSLQELFNTAPTIIADLAIVPTTIAIAHKRAKHILASITAAKFYQFIGVHIGYSPFNFFEISHGTSLKIKTFAQPPEIPAYP